MFRGHTVSLESENSAFPNFIVIQLWFETHDAVYASHVICLTPCRCYDNNETQHRTHTIKVGQAEVLIPPLLVSGVPTWVYQRDCWSDLKYIALQCFFFALPLLSIWLFSFLGYLLFYFYCMTMFICEALWVCLVLPCLYPSSLSRSVWFLPAFVALGCDRAVICEVYSDKHTHVYIQIFGQYFGITAETSRTCGKETNHISLFKCFNGSGGIGLGSINSRQHQQPYRTNKWMATENKENTEATKKNAWKHLGISSHHSKKIHDSSKTSMLKT